MVNAIWGGGSRGARRSSMVAASRERFPFLALQARQATTQFVQLETPPSERGTTWSIDRSSVEYRSPQYWQVFLSRRKRFRREKITFGRVKRSQVRSTITSGMRIESETVRMWGSPAWTFRSSQEAKS